MSHSRRPTVPCVLVPRPSRTCDDALTDRDLTSSGRVLWTIDTQGSVCCTQTSINIDTAVLAPGNFTEPAVCGLCADQSAGSLATAESTWRRFRINARRFCFTIIFQQSSQTSCVFRRFVRIIPNALCFRFQDFAHLFLFLGHLHSSIGQTIQKISDGVKQVI